MSGHYTFDDQTQQGRILRRVLNAVDTLLTDGPELQATLAQMTLGAGTADADYAEIAYRLRFVGDGVPTTGAPDNSVAHAAVSEFNSMLGKLTTDADVTAVNAALKQAAAKFR